MSQIEKFNKPVVAWRWRIADCHDERILNVTPDYRLIAIWRE
jgi:hypothetical protein